MNHLPKTLSKDVILYAKSWYTDDKSHESNPNLLLKFVQQAYQDYRFLNREVKFMAVSFSLLAHMTLTGKLSMEAVTKSVAFMAKFYKKGKAEVGDVCFYFEKKKVSCNRLFMLPHCTALRERWIKEPNHTELSIIEFLPADCPSKYASLLVSDYLADLFVTFFGLPLNAEVFLIIDRVPLFWLIQFCKNIGYEYAYKELQKVYCVKIYDYKNAFEELVKARKYNLSIIEEFCKNFLNELDLYHLVTEGSRFEVAVTILIDPSHIKSSIDLGLLTRGYLDYPYPILNTDICIFLAHLYRINAQTAMLNCERANITQFTKHRNSISTSSPVKLGSLPIEHVILNGQSLICPEIFVGLCLFFDKVINISFAKMKEIPESIVAEVVTVKPDIECVSISHPQAPIKSKDIILLGKKFLNLKKIGFSFSDVKKEIITAVLNTKSIVKIEIASSNFELPDDLSGLDRIIQLELIAICEVPIYRIKRLISAASNIKYLCINNVNNYSLGDYPYPQNIHELTGFFDSLYADRQHLKRFTNLKILKILGPSEHAFQLMSYLPRHITLVVGNLTYIK